MERTSYGKYSKEPLILDTLFYLAILIDRTIIVINNFHFYCMSYDNVFL